MSNRVSVSHKHAGSSIFCSSITSQTFATLHLTQGWGCKTAELGTMCLPPDHTLFTGQPCDLQLNECEHPPLYAMISTQTNWVGSYTRDRGPRCEGIDSVCHASTPTGGRANLRNLVGACTPVCRGANNLLVHIAPHHQR
eukprot:1161386-Pelagomonas_calceolata.AAC.3